MTVPAIPERPEQETWIETLTFWLREPVDHDPVSGRDIYHDGWAEAATLLTDLHKLAHQYRNDMMFPNLDSGQRSRRLEWINEVLGRADKPLDEVFANDPSAGSETTNV